MELLIIQHFVVPRRDLQQNVQQLLQNDGTSTNNDTNYLCIINYQNDVPFFRKWRKGLTKWVIIAVITFSFRFVQTTVILLGQSIYLCLLWNKIQT